MLSYWNVNILSVWVPGLSSSHTLYATLSGALNHPALSEIMSVHDLLRSNMYRKWMTTGCGQSQRIKGSTEFYGHNKYWSVCWMRKIQYSGQCNSHWPLTLFWLSFSFSFFFSFLRAPMNNTFSLVHASSNLQCSTLDFPDWFKKSMSPV